MKESKIKGKVYVYDPATGKMVDKAGRDLALQRMPTVEVTAKENDATADTVLDSGGDSQRNRHNDGRPQS